MRVLNLLLFSLLFFQSINVKALENDENRKPIQHSVENKIKLENNSLNGSGDQLSDIIQDIAFVQNNWETISTLAIIPACSATELDLTEDENLLNEINRQKKLWDDLLVQSTFTEEKLLRTIEAVKNLLIATYL